MSKIEAKTVQLGHRDGHRKRSRKEKPLFPLGKVASPTGFEPVLPT
jgi:hypothetical protein